MSNASEVREFLTTRQAKATPQAAAVPLGGR
jgi:hypothetical protein